MNFSYPKTPSRKWGKKTANVIKEELTTLFNNTDFVDRDYLDDAIIEIYFVPVDYKDVKIKYKEVISLVSKAFETRCIWSEFMMVNYIKPIKTFYIIGYEKDVLNTLKYLNYIINGFNNLVYKLSLEYRRTKINQRRRLQNKGLKTPKLKDARHKAVSLTNSYIESLVDNINQVNMIFSVLHEYKLEGVDKYLLMNKKLNFKKYHIKNRGNTINDAFCKKKQFIVNRIII